MHPVIVIGPPRSGTSVITRLLQTHLGLMMDEGPILKDLANPKGYFEDHRVVRINQIACKNWKPGVGHEKKIDPQWAIPMMKFAALRTLRYKTRWGWKDPRCIGFVTWVKELFPNAIWIATDRKDDQIIGSSTEKLMDKESIKVALPAYRRLIAQHLPNRHIFDMTKRQSESDLVKRMRKILWL